MPSLTGIPFWLRIVAPLALLAGLWFWSDHRGYQRAETKAIAQIQRVEAKAAASLNAVKSTALRMRADQVERARRIETANRKVTDDVEASLRGRIAALRAGLRTPAAGNPGGDQAGMPSATDTTRDTAGAGGASELVADRLICGEAIIKAEGWAEWWTRIRKFEDVND